MDLGEGKKKGRLKRSVKSQEDNPGCLKVPKALKQEQQCMGGMAACSGESQACAALLHAIGSDLEHSIGFPAVCIENWIVAKDSRVVFGETITITESGDEFEQISPVFGPTQYLKIVMQFIQSFKAIIMTPAVKTVNFF